LKEITGYDSKDFILGKVGHFIIHPDDRERIEKLKEKLLSGEITSTKVDYKIILPDKSQKWIRSYIKVIEGGKEIVLSLEDVTDKRLAEERKKEILFLAIHDSLTELYNRNFVDQLLPKVIEFNKINRTFGAALFIDLDNFKLVNDVYGHHVGDEILRIIAKRLRKAIRKSDIACRLGGDEFFVVLNNLGKSKTQAIEKARDIALRISECVAEPIIVNGMEFMLTCSIGILVFSCEYSPEELLKFSDMAMYEAKKSGRNRIHFFDSSLKERIEWEEKIESKLRRTIISDKLKVFYQPQVLLRKLSEKPKVIGVEALVRWFDEDLGSVSPGVFIPIAEESGLASELGFSVLRKVAKQVQDWQKDRIKRSWRASVNISYHQIIKDDFVENVEKILKEFSIPPSKICFEITENILVKDFEETRKILQYLKSIGISISIDDFGTGYSSLSYLRELPIDEIKIDRIFVKEIHQNQKNQQLVEAIISIGKIFETQVLAEGVETSEELQTLLNLQCELFQGFLFGRPTPNL